MIHFLDAKTDRLLGYLDGSEEKMFHSDLIEQSVDGPNTFTFTLPAKLPEAVGIEDRQRILIPAERRGFQEFMCYNAVQIGKDKRVVSTGSEVELNKVKVLQPAKYDGYTLRQYVSLATDGIDWEPGEIVGGQIKDFTIDQPIGGFDFLKRIATLFGVEFTFRVEVEHRAVTGRYVDAQTRIGSKTGKEFINAKDLVSVQKEVFTERFITALWVIMPNDAEGNPRNPVLVTDMDAFQRWNRKGQHLFGIHTIESDDAEMTVSKATELGKNELEKRIAAVVEYTVDAVDLSPLLPHEAAFLGDTVRIIDDEFNPPLFAEARIISVKRNVPRDDETMPRRKTFTIGEITLYSADDVERNVADMRRHFESLIRNVERQALDAAATAEGVVGSARLQELLNQKADIEAVGRLINAEQLGAFETQMVEKIQTAVRTIDMSDYITGDTAEERFKQIQRQVQDANSYNIIRNSVGYAGLAFWDLKTSNDNVFSVMNSALERQGFGAGFHFPKVTGTVNRVMEQVMNVTEGETITFSFYVEKGQPGAVLAEILEDGVVVATIPDLPQGTYPFTLQSKVYTPTAPQIAIRYTVAPAAEVTITGSMVAVGNIPKAWTTARGELYNAYVRVDERGMSVYRLDANGDIEGYSVVSPEEFAIYYDENKNGDLEKVFWFSRDSTNTKRLNVLQDISIQTSKILYINSASSRGLAFVRRELTEDE